MTTVKRSRAVSPQTRKQAAQLRRDATSAEALVWQQLRAHKSDGFKFRRQHPISGYIVDFCCIEAGLVVELDGDVHAGREGMDEQRTQILNSLGYRVVRFTNEDVKLRLPDLLAEILNACQQETAARTNRKVKGSQTRPTTIQIRPTPNPSPVGRGVVQWNPSLYDGKHGFVAKYGEVLLDLLAPKLGEHILDLGCGTGDLAQKITDCDATVVGLDSSLDMIEAAHAKYPAIEFVLGDATNFAFDEPFDAVFSNATLHWVKPPEDAVRCIASALKPGGRFVAEFGGAGNVANIADAIHDTRYALTGEDHPHEWYFPSIGEYAPILEAHGLEVQAAWLFDRPTRLDGEDGMRNWLRMFGGGMLRGLATDVIDRVTANAERTLQTTNYTNGHWFADYRRIRVVAVKSQ